MSETFHDHATLIAELGGAARVADAAGIDTLPVNVRAWAARNRIPPEYWPGLIAFASSLSVVLTADWLMRTTPARASRSAPIEQVSA
jgi:hypothetical protein